VFSLPGNPRRLHLRERPALPPMPPEDLAVPVSCPPGWCCLVSPWLRDDFHHDIRAAADW
jgi:hypothetical protein